MKQRLVAATVLFVLVVGIALGGLGHLRRITGELSVAITTGMRSAQKQTSTWQSQTQHIAALWKKHAGFLHMLLPHVNLNELEWSLGSLPEFCARGEATLYIEQCVRALQCLRTVREMEQPSWGNIF